MKIALVNSLYSPNLLGGAERSVQALAEGLLALGNEVVAISTADQEVDTRGEVNGVRVHYLGYKNRYWTFDDRPRGPIAKAAWHARDSYNRPMAGSVAAVLGRERPDVVHTHTLAGISVAVWDAVHEMGIPIVHTLRDYYLMCPKSTMFTGRSNCRTSCAACSLYAIPRKATSRRVEAVVGVSGFIVQKHLDNGYFPAATRARAIHNGYDAGPVLLADREPIAGHLVVGYLGTLSPSKGIDELLQAVATFPEGRITCLVAGSGRGGYEEALKRRHDRPNVRFVGQQPASVFLRSIDVLAVPSLWEEPFGRVLIESLSVGTPVVATPRGGMPEVVRDGVDAILTDGDSVESLRRALGRLVDEPGLLPALRRNAADRVEAKSVRAMAEEYEQLYREVRSAASRTPGLETMASI